MDYHLQYEISPISIRNDNLPNEVCAVRQLFAHSPNRSMNFVLQERGLLGGPSCQSGLEDPLSVHTLVRASEVDCYRIILEFELTLLRSGS